MTSYEDRLAAFTGKVLVPGRIGPDPVNRPMIRHWAEAMGDGNPVYVSDEAARAAGRDGVVAPATMMQAWTMRGYAPPAAAGPFDELVDLLAEGGYTSVVATDSDLKLVRELVPGDRVSVEEVVESISPEKNTALGAGRFVTTVKTYRDVDGEVVATQQWRTLRFRPAPSQEPRPRPVLNPDNTFWFEAARDRRLVVQRCTGCGTLRHPPGPCCPDCRSFDWDTVEASGRATLYSYVVAHHPRHPAFEYPLLIALVELGEGTRLITNLIGVTADEVTIGMALELDWHEAGDGLVLPAFRPVPAKER